MLHNWVYLLKDKDSGEYIYLDSNNSVQYSADPIGLTYTPDGWQKKSIAWERDLSKFGLVRSFTVNLGFVLDGKTLTDKIAIQQSFEALTELIIQKLNFNTTTDAFEYINFYIGELNFPALESEETKTSIPVADGGVTKQLKANENTVYEFTPDEINLYHDGVTLSMTQNWLITEGAQVESFGNGVHMIGCVQTTRDGQAAGFASFDSFFDKSEVSDLDSDLRYIFTTTQAINNVRVKGIINVHAGFTNTYTVTLKSNLGQIFTPINAVSIPNDTDRTFNFDFTVNSDVNEKWFLFGRFGTGGPSDLITYKEGELHVSFKSRYKSTYIKGITAYELFKRLTEKITGDKLNAQSTLLSGLQNIVISCGDQLRGIGSAKLKTNLSDFYRFCKVLAVAGIGVENEKIVIEALTHFFKTTSPVNLGECRNFKWKFAEEFLFNILKIGWENKTSDDVNGKYIFNATHNYSTPITSVSKVLELVTNYVADPFYHENVRINLDGKTTTDNDSDNEIMVFNTVQTTENLTADILFDNSTSEPYLNIIGIDDQIEKFAATFTISGTSSNNKTFTIKRVEALTAGGFNVFVNETVVSEAATGVGIEIKINSLLREAYTNTDTGVPDIDTLYNIIYFTPKRILKRWMPYINSCLFQFFGLDLNFESTEKNRELKTNNGTEIIDEDADETVSSERWFKAIFYNFETTVDDVVPETLSSDPNSGFTTTNPLNGKDFTGILIKGAMACNEETPQSFRLLAGKDEDENNLL